MSRIVAQAPFLSDLIPIFALSVALLNFVQIGFVKVVTWISRSCMDIRAGTRQLHNRRLTGYLK